MISIPGLPHLPLISSSLPRIAEQVDLEAEGLLAEEGHVALQLAKLAGAQNSGLAAASTAAAGWNFAGGGGFGLSSGRAMGPRQASQYLYPAKQGL